MMALPDADFRGAFSALSREVELLCEADGTVVWADERARRLLALAPGAPLANAAVGSAEKIAGLLEATARSPVRGWELAMVADGAPVTIAFCGQRVDGKVALVGSLVPEDHGRALDKISVAMQQLGELHRETVVQRSQLAERNAELVRLNQQLSDSNSGIVTMHAELAEKADALRRSSDVKGRVVASVSHEFRTPLNAILGMSTLLLDEIDGPLTPEQQRQVRYMRSSAEELLHLVNDLLDLTKVEAGKTALRAERFSLAEFLASMRGSLRPLLPADAAVSFVVEEPDEDVELDTDKGKLAQIVRNLVSNALKFTERGEIRVTADLHADGHLELRVADTGIGIAPADHERIFEEFSQIENPLQKKVQGTGLGLPLSRRLAELLGGALSVASEVGQGSAFTLSLPLVHPEVTEMNAISSRGALPAPPGMPPVLVVEDDRRSVFVYEKYLTMAGFHVIAVRTTDEARAVLETRRPAAVVLDIMLENETSWQFLADVKRNPQTHDIPVLVVTVADQRDRARALGADEFWLKPIDQARLLKKLRSLVRSGLEARVVMIDDDPTSRYLVQRYLQDTPFELLEAETGAQGVELARERHPHVILLDFLLRESTAFDVLDDLKSDPATRHIPVIVVTSQVLDAADRSRLLDEAEAVISKQNLSRELALSRIRDALRKAVEKR